MKTSPYLFLSAICLLATSTSCTLLGKHKLEDKIDQLEHKMPKEITAAMKADEIEYDDNKNVVEIKYVWDVTASDIAWTSPQERKQEVLSLVNIKKIDRSLPDLIDKAEAGIEIEVELADGTDVATITYPNISTFNAAAHGEATDVAE